MSCELCKRDLETTSHHLIPKQIHSKSWCKKMFTKEEMNGRRANLCRDCHPYLHKKFSHAELGRFLNTIEKLLSHDKVLKFVKFVSKQRKKVKR